ncbi:MAG: tRNA (adenosine(37)-N6)-threonylcarbamoyltransferase complex dimerization subunit type 1 TsaB [Fastidiosipilaceae bacterium]|jgi:tRNA threonylcarbamoyladenosine biosynthesis protein TsaB
MNPEIGHDVVLLTLDSSGHSCSAAVSRGQTVLAEIIVDTGKTHSQALVRLCETVLSEANLRYEDLTGLACVNGPGSYTGIRIGVSTCMGMAFAANKPVIGVSSLAALAEPWGDLKGVLICPHLDARGQRCFAQVFLNHDPLNAPAATNYLSYIDEIAQFVRTNKLKDVLLCGSGTPMMSELAEWRAFLSQEGLRCFDAGDTRISAAGAARIAYREIMRAGGRALQNPVTLEANYLALSQAERLSQSNIIIKGEK